MSFSYSTSDLPIRQKVQFWQDAVCNLMIPAEAVAQIPSSFNASLDGCRLGDVTICQMNAPAHTFSRTATLLRRKPDEDFVLVYVVSGENGFEQEGRVAVGGAGTIVLLDAARPFLHDFRSSIIYTVKIPRRRLLARFPRAELLTGVNLKSHPATTLLPPLIMESQVIADERASGNSEQRFNTILIDTVALALEMLVDESPSMRGSRHDDVYRKATDYIAENFADTELDVLAVSNAACVSPRTLSRIFALRGVSVMQHVWSFRLEMSHRILSTGGADSVTTAAFESGFSDLSHFTKVFKRKYGVSPSSIRKP
ncbi:helix-turn-helix domain-containing protein [Rhizobium hainanense]|uniref:AraC-type DNA-binding protein n=1 Tax=Rhizobium hainanense TaxID=52131 RepID=A0A1C3W8P4_9HYPH|nr:helix-turn-helix domain-containing protein [Rhizobium hainanense]SCB36527.1 AraC-type DNA-binding protein [Rhizobium hainanense]